MPSFALLRRATGTTAIAIAIAACGATVPPASAPLTPAPHATSTAAQTPTAPTPPDTTATPTPTATSDTPGPTAAPSAPTDEPTPASTSTASPTASPTATPATTQPAAPVEASTPPPAPPPADPEPEPSGTPGPRQVVEQAWTPFAQVTVSDSRAITLHHPSSRVERIGFHESNHDGAQQQTVLETAAAPITLETRNRDTVSRGSADIVVDPDVEVRAPATGTIKRAGTYTLYCEHTDSFAVIEPDGLPGWEVKLLHVTDLTIRAGDRVEAGVTVIARAPTPLPFRSQVDDHTAEPSWPHVHVEVVNTAIPDRKSPGGGC